ncbi:MAG: hypothetical protein ABI644_01000 [Arenimonas sp.]
MKARYWIFIVVLLAGSVLLGKFTYTSYMRMKNDYPTIENEDRKMAEIAKQVADVRSHAKKRPVIDMPYCANDKNTDLNIPNEQILRLAMRDCVFRLMEKKDYKTLDLMISTSRDKKLRTSSGLWLQGIFYQSMKEYLKLDNKLQERDFERIDSELEVWIAQSDSDTAKLVLVDSMIRRAWLYRGSGYANEISKVSFTKFHTQVAKAKKYLVANKEISTKDPKWFSEMLDVLNIGGNASPLEHKRYFDKAVSLYPEYYPIYYEASIFYYPWWHGDEPDSFDKFLVYATSKLPPDEAKVVYARIYLSSLCDECGEESKAWLRHWEQIAPGFDQILVDYPDLRNLNLYGWMACSAGDKKRTLAILRKIKQDVEFQIWKEPNTYNYCVKMSNFFEENRKLRAAEVEEALRH